MPCSYADVLILEKFAHMTRKIQIKNKEKNPTVTARQLVPIKHSKLRGELLGYVRGTDTTDCKSRNNSIEIR